LNQRNLAFAWLGSILLLSIFAGFSWLTVELTLDAGGQSIDVTGYSAFPVISALMLLQTASLLASFFTPTLVSRWIAGLLAPVMLGHGLLLVSGLEAAIETSLTGSISQITGVAGVSSQLPFIATAANTYLWVGYLAAMGLNVALLLIKAFLDVVPAKKTEAASPSGDAGDLWESQK
jgi:hypothetical protein